jgi:hypothetical protein
MLLSVLLFFLYLSFLSLNIKFILICFIRFKQVSNRSHCLAIRIFNKYWGKSNLKLGKHLKVGFPESRGRIR